MVKVPGTEVAWTRLRKSLLRLVIVFGGATLLLVIGIGSCTTRVLPNEWGVEQVRIGSKVGIGDVAFGPGLYILPIGTSMHTFPREMHLFEASNEREEFEKRAKDSRVRTSIDEYYARRERVLGGATHRRMDALNVQTSDGYAVRADVSLLYSIDDPVRVAREFGWGSGYIDSFVVNTFRNGVLATLGKMAAEQFYDEQSRVKAVHEAETFLRMKFEERGFSVQHLLLRDYHYSDSYEKSLQDKKVAVQLTEKNRKEALVNEERARLQQLESKGNAAITIAESEIDAQISKIRAEAELYSSQVRASGDRDLGVAESEAKRLTSEALTLAGGRYVVALETARMFDNIESAVMTPEQYSAFIRNAWSLIGLSPGGAR